MSEIEPLLGEADRTAERLVAWIRTGMALVLAAAILIVVLPSDRPDDAVLDRQVVQAVVLICAYLLLGVSAIFLSRPGWFRSWMAWAFAAGDLILFGWGLAFSVSNTGVGGGFAFAMPTMMLAPVILAYGALRFRPGLQIGLAVGIMTVLISVMVWAGGWSDPLDSAESAAIGNLFDPPPVIMRTLMLALSGAVLAIGVYRGKALLHRAIDEARRRANLTRFLPGEVAETLSETDLEALRTGRETHAVVFFVDIRGFTAWSRDHGSAEICDLLSRYRALIGRAATSQGGFVDKFIGDGALVVFGALDDDHDDVEARSLKAALAILGDIDTLGGAEPAAPLRIGIGIASGTVFIGAVGDADRMEFTVLGDTVNIAARLEGTTKDVGFALVVTEAFANRCGATVPGWHDLGPRRLSGVDDAVSLAGAFAYPATAGRTAESAAVSAP